MQVEPMAELMPPLIEIEGEVIPNHATTVPPEAA
jgi:hypothetical protein